MVLIFLSYTRYLCMTCFELCICFKLILLAMSKVYKISYMYRNIALKR